MCYCNTFYVRRILFGIAMRIRLGEAKPRVRMSGLTPRGSCREVRIIPPPRGIGEEPYKFNTDASIIAVKVIKEVRVSKSVVSLADEDVVTALLHLQGVVRDQAMMIVSLKEAHRIALGLDLVKQRRRK